MKNLSINNLILSVINHPVYLKIDTPYALRTYMEHHVFFVLDFMFLVKSIQNKFTNTSNIWSPVCIDSKNPMLGCYINEIVATEETDRAFGGKSHLTYYIDAMKEAKADTSEIMKVIKLIKEQKYIDLLDSNNMVINGIVKQIYDLKENPNPYVSLGVFAIARENIIPEMFTNIVKTIDSAFPGNFTKMRTYLDRHIELDGEEHGPMSRMMLEAIPEEYTDAVQNAIEKDLIRRFNMLNMVYSKL